MTRIAWLPEPPKHTEKAAFFRAIADVAGAGVALNPVAVSLRGFDSSGQRAAEAQARAKKPGGAAKRLFLQGRYNWARHWFTRNPDATALCWQGQTGTRWAVMQGARDAGAKTFFAELAPLPGYLTLDPRGVNAAGSVPQDPGFYTDPADQPLLDGLKANFVARTPRRADVGQGGRVDAGGKYLFVPLQVPDDSQMVLFAGWAGDMPGFIAALAQASAHLPEGWHLRLKEHPSAQHPLTAQIDAAIASGARMVRDNQTDSFAQLAGSEGVVTVNSSMGLQALFFDKPVIVTGRSFYALPGVAHHADTAQALAQAFTALPDFDPALRARFLTWLATRYYIAKTADGFDRAQIAARLAGDL